MTAVRVAFQGELGAYGDHVIVERWRGSATGVPSRTFEDVIASVASGIAVYGVIPIWNSSIGDIVPGRAAVQLGCGDQYNLAIIGDARVAVRHHLLGLPGSSLDEIDTVSSHPAALAQCGRFLHDHPGLVVTPVYDTAGAARDLASFGKPGSSAIAGARAASLYGLAVLKPEIQDDPDNFTHFVILAAHPAARHELPERPHDEPRRW